MGYLRLLATYVSKIVQVSLHAQYKSFVGGISPNLTISFAKPRKNGEKQRTGTG